MIAFLILLVLITGYMVCAEIVFERDWPRCTIKGFIIALALLFMGFQAFGQASRFDQVVSTINASAPAPGGLYPALYIPGSGINICNAPANAVPCTNYATTYTNAVQSATCTAPTQLTRPGANICVKDADEEGGWGVWMVGGTYQYTITTTYGSFGPYDFSVGGAGGAGNPAPPVFAPQINQNGSSFGPTPQVFSTGGLTDQTSFQTQVTAAAGGTLQVSNQVNITSNFTIPSNVSISALPSGVFNISSGAILTINGPITAGRWQIFSGSGTVSFATNAAISSVYPEWWGAQPDGGTGTFDSSPAWQSAVSLP